MEKTLLQPSKYTDNNLPKVNSNDESISLEKLVDEMKPHLDNAADQLLQPEQQTLDKLFKKILH